MSKVNTANAIDVVRKYVLADIFNVVLDLEKSQGNRLYDSAGKRFLLDCFSYIATNPIGHNHPKLDEPAFEKKLLRAAKTKPSNSDIWGVELAEFIDTLARVALPKGFEHMFFIEGGTLGVENALKAAIDWKVRLNFSRGAKEERGYQIIHFKEAFHGRSGYCMSLTNTADPRKFKHFPRYEWPRINNPKCRFPLQGDNLTAVISAEQQSLNDIRAALKSNADDIAAIIIEPIQAEGGDNHFRPEFHQELRRIADTEELLLIYDEVQTGVGLTGKMWAFEHFGIVPDMIAFGKKMQVCGFFSTTRIDSVKDNVFQEKSRISSTWGGGLVDMVRAQRFLEVIEEDNLVENARIVGNYFIQQLEKLAAKHSGIISNIRGKGLMCAMDLPSTEIRDKLKVRMFELGAMVIGCGNYSIRLRPSLTFSTSEVDELIDIIDKGLAGI